MIEVDYKGTPLYHFESLQKCTAIKHYVSGRKGGVSTGEFGSLNIGFGTADSKENVVANRLAIAQALVISYEQLIFARQTHGNEVLIVDEPFLALSKEAQSDALYEKDALISQNSQICLCVTAGDCVPILLYDPVNQAIGAIHAGWRGTSQQILVKTILAMKSTFGTEPANIIAGIGPSISGKVYEVGAEVIEAMEQAMGSTEGLISHHNQETGKALLDLWETNKQQLLRTGVNEQNIEIANICTYTQQESFFSARRFGGKGGRFSAGIMLI